MLTAATMTQTVRAMTRIAQATMPTALAMTRTARAMTQTARAMTQTARAMTRTALAMTQTDPAMTRTVRAATAMAADPSSCPARLTPTARTWSLWATAAAPGSVSTGAKSCRQAGGGALRRRQPVYAQDLLRQRRLQRPHVGLQRQQPLYRRLVHRLLVAAQLRAVQ